MSYKLQPLKKSEPQPTEAPAKPTRLVSLDAYRGAIMLILAASGFGFGRLTRLQDDAPLWDILDRDIWHNIAWYFQHPTWVSQFSVFGLSPWDLIQPAFMFMVGVAMPYSYSRRSVFGQTEFQRHCHAFFRALVLILLGVFLQSKAVRYGETNWVFTNVLSQIGLGYFFVYLMLSARWKSQIAAIILILVGYWGFFKAYDVPANYDYEAVGAVEEARFSGSFAPWSMNANMGHQVDLKLLNVFPRTADSDGEVKPYTHNAGGYVTLNFIPSMATMLLGVLCGQLLLGPMGGWKKLGVLIVGAAICYGLGILAGEYACPIVKRIWTPSWALFSGGYVIAMLALFYLVFDLLKLRFLAFPLVVVGMNSLLMYMMGQLIPTWTTEQVKKHFGRFIEAAIPGAFDMQTWGLITAPTVAVIVFWLIAYWLYRQKIFIRV